MPKKTLFVPAEEVQFTVPEPSDGRMPSAVMANLTEPDATPLDEDTSDADDRPESTDEVVDIAAVEGADECHVDLPRDAILQTSHTWAVARPTSRETSRAARLPNPVDGRSRA